ncbi:MAG: transcriptional regulator [Marinomonas sp.]|jgi:DNA-binding transcriptional ArsR family regulator|uniref:ArsR family transcriptional regulator n=1 Tax=Marinomonas communis TaxID=28254 RepID=A0A4V3DGR1_9GAMM|nr:metalloregulator ArsR/SmtB family transcription factor [Marinomonas communis]MAF15229.1 transcriptional regulator [Marinomonas sp.]MEC8082020.1 metalloregulator ArsR/SmtB family transcription factor [Pseudomonadota bacterium]MAF16498.1 transcriptional regulator [Marinomonas sp.]MCC4275163.1 metalloregulator ArsR/SmtB family transcription factor [Marinomonas communis]MEC8483309.1 metalloregulator ArsR/SmtB family transcription factor [Pseudomonadota bacterium]
MQQTEIEIKDMLARASEASVFLKALSNENRLIILCNLLQDELSVGALNERVLLSQSALSQHLAVLRKDGLVTTRRDSQTIFYSIADPRVKELIQTLHDLFCAD